MYLIGNSSDEERRTARQHLVVDGVRFIFVADIYNEGVDILEVNTALFLRPTESFTVFCSSLEAVYAWLRIKDAWSCWILSVRRTENIISKINSRHCLAIQRAV